MNAAQDILTQTPSKVSKIGNDDFIEGLDKLTGDAFGAAGVAEPYEPIPIHRFDGDEPSFQMDSPTMESRIGDCYEFQVKFEEEVEDSFNNRMDLADQMALHLRLRPEDVRAETFDGPTITFHAKLSGFCDRDFLHERLHMYGGELADYLARPIIRVSELTKILSGPDPSHPINQIIDTPLQNDRAEEVEELILEAVEEELGFDSRLGWNKGKGEDEIDTMTKRIEQQLEQMQAEEKNELPMEVQRIISNDPSFNPYDYNHANKSANNTLDDEINKILNRKPKAKPKVVPKRGAPSFDAREKKMSIRQRRLEADLAAKKRKEEEELKEHEQIRRTFRAKPVPVDNNLPKFQAMEAHAKAKKMQKVSLNRKQVVGYDNTFQYGSYYRDPKNNWQGTAKPVPPSSSLPLYNQMVLDDNARREQRTDSANRENAMSSTLPPRMEAQRREIAGEDAGKHPSPPTCLICFILFDIVFRSCAASECTSS